MTTMDTPPDADEILRAIRLRLEVLRPLVAEHDQLAKADAAIERGLAKL